MYGRSFADAADFVVCEGDGIFFEGVPRDVSRVSWDVCSDWGCSGNVFCEGWFDEIFQVCEDVFVGDCLCAIGEGDEVGRGCVECGVVVVAENGGLSVYEGDGEANL